MNNQHKQIQEMATFLGIVSQLYTTRMEQLLRRHQLTLSQLSLLSHLSRSEQREHTISELTAEMEINQPGVTKLVQRLEAQNLIAVQASPLDSRKKLVSITALGSETLQKTMIALGPDAVRWFAGWDQAECAQFLQSLKKLAAWLDENRLG
jgi:DNA-binding MarR family transcriptional regulator